MRYISYMLLPNAIFDCQPSIRLERGDLERYYNVEPYMLNQQCSVKGARKPKARLSPDFRKWCVVVMCSWLHFAISCQRMWDFVYGKVYRKVTGNVLSAVGSVPVVDILMDPGQVPHPSQEVPRHQQHGRTPREVEASGDNEQKVTRSAALDEQVTVVPVHGHVVQS